MEIKDEKLTDIFYVGQIIYYYWNHLYTLQINEITDEYIKCSDKGKDSGRKTFYRNDFNQVFITLAGYKLFKLQQLRKSLQYIENDYNRIQKEISALEKELQKEFK